MSFSKKLILAASLLLIFATQAAQSLQCYECKDADGKCKNAKLATCGEAKATTAAATTEAITTPSEAAPEARGEYGDYSEEDKTVHPAGKASEAPAEEEQSTESPPAAAAGAEGEAAEASPAPESFIQHQDEAATESSEETSATNATTVGGSKDWFCATLKGKMNKTAATFKGCSMKENDCSGIEPKGDFAKDSCKTCKKDKCNSGFNIKPITLPFLLVVIMPLISLYE